MSVRWRAAGPALSLALGLVLLAAVLYWQRDAWDGMAEAFVRLGLAGLLAVTVFHAFPLLLDALAWRAVLPPEDRVSVSACTMARWVGEAFTNVLPTAQIGGEVARGRALALLGVRYVAAGSSVVVDVTVGVVSELVYVVIGIGVFVTLAVGTDVAQRVSFVAAISGFLLILAVLVAAQMVRPFGRLLRRLGDRLGKGISARLLGGAAAVEDLAIRTYARRGALAECFGWRIAGWLAGAAEFWLALHLIDVPIGPLEAIALESAIQAVRSAVFMIPGGFGVQEAALVGLGGAFGLGPDVALALSLIKRAREYILGIAGVAAWYWLERRRRPVRA